MTHDRVKRRILEWGLDDWFYLASVVDFVALDGPPQSNDELVSSTLHVIRTLIEEGLIVVGDVKRQVGFVAWNESTDGALGRIECEWQLLDREPQMGEICWFANTAKGNELAKQSLAKADKASP